MATRFIDESREILKIALPLIAAQLLQVGMGVIDTIMAGRINALAMASIALGSAVWFFFILVGVGLMRVLPTSFSRYHGAKNDQAIRETVYQGFWLALFIGLISTLALILFVQALPFIGIDEQVVHGAKGYIYWICWSVPLSALYLVPRFLSEGLGSTLPVLSIQILLLPINILGNWVLMFGHWGFEPMGSDGAAISTGIAQLLGFVFLTSYVFYSKRYAYLQLREHFAWPDFNHHIQHLKLGIPIAISMGMEVGMFTIITLLMGRFGVDVVASHQIALNLASLTFMLPLGLSMAVTVRTSQALGLLDPVRAMRRAKQGLTLCVIVGSFSALLFILIPETLASLYTDKTHLITLATELLGIAAIFQLVDSLQIGGSGALLGYKDTKIPMLLSVISYWGGGLSVAVVSAFYLGYGPHGLWYGLTAGLALASIVINIRLYIVANKTITEGV